MGDTVWVQSGPSLTFGRTAADTGERRKGMMYRSEAGDRRRLEGARMAHKRESIVPMTPVRDADRSARVVGLSQPAPQRKARVAQLRQQVRSGYYATDEMMDAVARLIHRSGNL
jgi:hypothetical protein